MNREETAVNKRNHGYNCCQAVVCTYCDLIDLDEKTAFRLSEGLGAGLGCTLGTCGALNAACMLAGMETSTVNLEHPDSKGKTYRTIRPMITAFEQEAGALRCRDIKGIETGKVLCECEDCVRIACRLVEKYILHDNDEWL
jgi:C_GCAxxG_C_C family probable redox protein